jgi:transcriptional regulator with XRE-family HTH domain
MWEFRERLTREFEARQAANPRYSLRAFAAFLDTDHSTFSQILRGRRRIPAGQLRHWARKLHLTPEEIAVYVAAQHVPGIEVRDREEHLRHWTAEGLAIVNDPCHWQIAVLTRTHGFRGDSRLIAKQVGVSVDRVNVALARLLRLRLLEVKPRDKWKVLLRSKEFTEAAFKKLALVRVRELAAEDGVKLVGIKTESNTNS